MPDALRQPKIKAEVIASALQGLCSGAVGEEELIHLDVAAVTVAFISVDHPAGQI
ncbi:MAG TPA: hypothetical protein VF432_22880 [Thermoanaerobaculia bacterium]